MASKPKLDRRGNETLVVRISHESLERLKKFAEPLESTVDDAIRKVLDLLEAKDQTKENR